jgi:hypothetical protein
MDENTIIIRMFLDISWQTHTMPYKQHVYRRNPRYFYLPSSNGLNLLIIRISRTTGQEKLHYFLKYKFVKVEKFYLLDPYKWVEEFWINGFQVFHTKLLIQHSLIKWQCEASIDEFPMIKSLKKQNGLFLKTEEKSITVNYE